MFMERTNMNPEHDNIGYAHDHLGAIEQGMPVFDSDNHEIGTVSDIEFASNEQNGNKDKLKSLAQDVRDHLLKAGYIIVQNDQGAAWYAAGDQINYVNEGVVQLSDAASALPKIQ
jgi:sporulation protein YlmC with PRC-barrel domain